MTGRAAVLELGVAMAPGDYDQMRSRARRAEDAGFSFVSVGDNPGAVKETYVSLAVLAQSTSRCDIGTTVTDPINRDPLVVASAASSVASLAPGRVFLGIATGRARRPATLAQLREHVRILRSLWTTGEAEIRGERVRLTWDAEPVPVRLCVSGPKGLRLAGEIADSIIVESGLDVATVERVKGWIAEGAAIAGRDPDAIDLWWYAKASIAEDEEEAMRDAMAPVAASGGFVLGANPAVHGVPPEHWDGLRDLMERYDKAAHLRSDADNPNARLLGPGPLRDYLFDRFAIAGTPAQWQERALELRARGIQKVFCAAVVPDVERFIDLAGEALSLAPAEGARA